jgi:hypothetical protein
LNFSVAFFKKKFIFFSAGFSSKLVLQVLRSWWSDPAAVTLVLYSLRELASALSLQWIFFFCCGPLAWTAVVWNKHWQAGRQACTQARRKPGRALVFWLSNLCWTFQMVDQADHHDITVDLSDQRVCARSQFTDGRFICVPARPAPPSSSTLFYLLVLAKQSVSNNGCVLPAACCTTPDCWLLDFY